MSEAARAAVLEAHCRELKLPSVRRLYPELVRQATQDGWDYEEFLLQLLEVEVLTRRDGAVARLLRQARFPDIKTLEQLDWEAPAGRRAPAARPARDLLRTIERAEDVVIAGPIGTGKTHLAIALGVEAARRRHRVAFVRAADLVRELVEARDELTLSRLHQRYQRVALLIVDELGFVPFERTGGELIFNLLADRYERRSTIRHDQPRLQRVGAGLRRREAHHGAARPPRAPRPDPDHARPVLPDAARTSRTRRSGASGGRWCLTSIVGRDQGALVVAWFKTDHLV